MTCEFSSYLKKIIGPKKKVKHIWVREKRLFTVKLSFYGHNGYSEQNLLNYLVPNGYLTA